VTIPRAGSHVLIVDDNPDLLQSLAEILELEGYRVSGAANGQEALAHLRNGPPPAVIILDLLMPVMNGWEFRAVQRSDPFLAPVPVILLSSLDGLDRLARELDAAASLRKPIEVSLLLETIARFCSPPIA